MQNESCFAPSTKHVMKGHDVDLSYDFDHAFYKAYDRICFIRIYFSFD